MNAEALVSRIRQLLDWQQLSPTQFADRIGVGRPVVSHILSERNKASLDVALRISEAFPELSLDWLLKGTGEMLAAAQTLPTAVPAQPTLAAATAVPVPPSAVPVAEEPVAASSPAAPLVKRSQPVSRPTVSRFQPNRPAVSASEMPGGSPASAAVPVVPPSPPEVPAQPAATEAATPTIPAASVPPVAGGPAASGGDAASLLAGFAEPGKAIRRIVIFYRDGSFADYQPEV